MVKVIIQDSHKNEIEPDFLTRTGLAIAITESKQLLDCLHELANRADDQDEE